MRLIGIDLAWGEHNGTGCAELDWAGDELILLRTDICRSLEEIVDWIEPDRGGWVVAVDAPLIVRNQSGRRQADAQVSARYHRFQAGAYPTNLTILGSDHRGGQLWRALERRGAELLELPTGSRAERFVFETFPHAAMVELFGLARTIKYKKGRAAAKRIGQQQLAEALRRHLHETPAGPRLRLSKRLAALLREPDPPLRGAALKSREDILDAIVCAYTAAWAAAARPLLTLGERGSGVVVLPQLHGPLC